MLSNSSQELINSLVGSGGSGTGAGRWSVMYVAPGDDTSLNLRESQKFRVDLVLRASIGLEPTSPPLKRFRNASVYAPFSLTIFSMSSAVNLGSVNQLLCPLSTSSIRWKRKAYPFVIKY